MTRAGIYLIAFGLAWSMGALEWLGIGLIMAACTINDGITAT